jgi:hypothetical protein
VNERDLGRALLKLDAAELGGVPDARRLTWQIIERDRRWVGFLTAVTVGAWLLAVALVLAGLVGYGFLMPEQAKLLQEIEAGKVTAAQREQAQRELLVGFQKGTLLIAFSVAVLAVAALCTVLLLLASRRATLRQLNAGLLEVAEQLRRLRQVPGGPAS